MSRKSTVSSWLSYYSTFYRVCKPILFAKGWKIVKKWPLHGNQGPLLVLFGEEAHGARFPFRLCGDGSSGAPGLVGLGL